MDGESFSSPELAAEALVKAATDKHNASILKILGPSAKDVLFTSDQVADERARDAFVRKAKEKLLITGDPKTPSRKVIEIGKDRWPFPIPIVRVSGKWRFDVEEGKQEILLRRVGNNELTVIDVCRGYVEAQNEYFNQNPGARQYAPKVISSPGQRDGLYWPSTTAVGESPIGEAIAKAIAEGYTRRGDPYHGYYFKVLTAQGTHASGGAMDYFDKGKMTRGFALIAWPSDYHSTGVMTFIVDRGGIVYQKDLGANTSKIASTVTAYDPDETWLPVAGSGVPESKPSARKTRASR